jgi:hypothetical protein
MNLESSVEDTLKRKILDILQKHAEGIIFDELREDMEKQGIYVDGIMLRKIVADLIREKIVCKEPSPKLRKMVLKLCSNSNVLLL